MDYVNFPCSFTAERIEADRITRNLHDQVWVEREHQHHLQSQSETHGALLVATEPYKSRTVDG